MSTLAELWQRLEAEAGTIGTTRGPAGAARTAEDDTLALALIDVARHYGIATQAVCVGAGLPVVDGRLPLEHVEGAAARMGLRAALVSAASILSCRASLPAIFVTGDQRALIVWSISEPASGSGARAVVSVPGAPQLRSELAAGDLDRAGAGRIVTLAPAEAEADRAPEASRATDQPWLRSAFSGTTGIYAEAIAATLAINVLALALPLYTMNVYDRVLPNAAVETLWSLSIGVVLAVLFDFLIKLLRSRFVDTAGRRADVLLGNLVCGRLVGARMSGPPASAGVRANTIRELDTLREFYASATLTTFGDLPFLVLFLAMIAVVGGWLAIIPILSVPLLLAIGWLTQRSVGRLTERIARQSAIKNAVVVETVAGLETIKAAGAEGWAASQWERAASDSIRSSTEIKHLSNTGIYLVHAAQTLTQVAMIVAGFYMASAGALTMGALIASTMLAGRAMQPLTQLALLVSRLHQIKTSYRMLSEIVTAPQERPDDARFVAPVRGAGRLAFEAVSFRYLKDAAPVLDGVSFSLEPGDRAALVGGIGTGKSTILRLAQALREPQAGRVMLDGVPASHLDPAILRSRIGLALQGGEIFSGTLRSNILLQLTANDEALIEAARIAGALGWIARLPRGFDTQVGERGAGLSGGQRQTLLLARLIVRDPQVVLLDEPTSDLDPRTEQMVVEHLARWLEGRTALIVTHRPAMLALVDRLIVLEAGKVRFDGPKTGVLAAMAAANGLASAKAKGRPS